MGRNLPITNNHESAVPAHVVGAKNDPPRAPPPDYPRSPDFCYGESLLQGDHSYVDSAAAEHPLGERRRLP